MVYIDVVITQVDGQNALAVEWRPAHEEGDNHDDWKIAPKNVTPLKFIIIL